MAFFPELPSVIVPRRFWAHGASTPGPAVGSRLQGGFGLSWVPEAGPVRPSCSKNKCHGARLACETCVPQQNQEQQSLACSLLNLTYARLLDR